MEKEKIRDIVSRELMLTMLWNSHPFTMKDLENSLVEALHQALSMSGVSGSACSCTSEMERWNCEKSCENRPKIVQS